MDTYSDGTPIVAPFWLLKCTKEDCRLQTWSVLHHDRCIRCGAKVICIPASDEKKVTGLEER